VALGAGRSVWSRLVRHGQAPERRSHRTGQQAKINGMDLFVRVVGEGRPIVVLHGGAEFDHTYFLPELDRLADSFRLVYYDQRGRGRSAAGVRPEDVTLASEIEDVDAVRREAGHEHVAVLGHSWGGLLAAEYAIRHPERVSHLILLDTVPLSEAGARRLREHLGRVRTPAEIEALEALRASEQYRSGALDADAEYLRIHFRPTVPPQLLDELVGRLRRHFTPETVVTAREIDHHLFDETLLAVGYDLLPALRRLEVPTLVLHGSEDFIPVPIAEEIAAAVPGARLAVLPDCGHFTYLERPDEVHQHVAELIR
jgi:proline iminopeptidase